MTAAWPHEIKKGRKFDQVIEGARDVFMRDGYEGASVDEIARAAGVSKATLYSYFPDKRLLFSEVARMECNRQADEALDVIDMDAPPEAVLTEAARRILSFFLSDFGQQVYRICVAESHRFPEFGRRFYDSGPAMVRHRLSTVLSPYVESGSPRDRRHGPRRQPVRRALQKRPFRAPPVRRLRRGVSERYRPGGQWRGRHVPRPLPRLKTGAPAAKEAMPSGPASCTEAPPIRPVPGQPYHRVAIAPFIVQRPGRAAG